MGKKTVGRINETLTELWLGIGVSGVIFQFTVVWLAADRIAYSAGLWMGVCMAFFLAWHMWKALDEALDAGEAGAQKIIRGRAMLRYGIVLVVLGILMVTGAANPLAAFLGVMTLKIAAYMQPVTHKVISKLRR